MSLRSIMPHVTSDLVGKRGLRAWKREKFEQMLDECRPFSIVLVKLAFNANRNSRKKPKKC